MSAVISFLLSYVLLYKYPAILVITFVGALALPLPSGTILMASAAFAAQGYLSFFWIIFIGIVGNIAGDNSGYWLARWYGVKALKWLGMKKLVDSEKYERINQELYQHPLLFIFVSRYMTGVAPAVNVISGLTKLSYKRYLIFEILGECAEVITFAGLGYTFGANWEYVNRLGAWAWLLVVGGAVMTYLFWHLFFKLRKNKS